MSRFRLKPKPVKPVRADVNHLQIDLSDGVTLQSVVQAFEKGGYDFSKVFFDRFNDYDCYFAGYRSKTDEEFQELLSIYHEELAIWNVWAKANAEQIKERKEFNRKKKETVKAKKKAIRLQRLSKAKAKIEKELAELEGAKSVTEG